MRIAILTLLFGAALADTSSYVTLKPTNGNKVCFIFVQPSYSELPRLFHDKLAIFL
jgi:hypothetical protein